MKTIPLFSLLLATTTAGSLGTANASDPHGHGPRLGEIIVQQVVQALASRGNAGEYQEYGRPRECDQHSSHNNEYRHRANAWKIVGGQFPRGRKVPEGWHSISWFQSHGYDVNRLALVNEDGQYYGGRRPGFQENHGHGGGGEGRGNHASHGDYEARGDDHEGHRH